MNHAIIAAGGRGKRFAGTVSKQFMTLLGKPLLLWSLELFESAIEIQEVILAYSVEDGEEPYRSQIDRANLTKIRLVPGGASRFESVCNAFRAIQPSSPGDGVLIHDAARPLLSRNLLHNILTLLKDAGTALPVFPIHETVKEVQGDRVSKTWPRDRFFVAQTPQGFRYDILQQSIKWADEHKMKPEEITDEAMLVEKAGFTVRTLPGEKRNLKITEPEDLSVAALYAEDLP